MLVLGCVTVVDCLFVFVFFLLFIAQNVCFKSIQYYDGKLLGKLGSLGLCNWHLVHLRLDMSGELSQLKFSDSDFMN